jgi:hypothetical protein
VKTQKILSMKVTADDERIHDDSKAVPELVENILKSDDISTTTTAIGKLFGDDGAYEGNEIFRYLENNGIMPCIKVRNNARVRWKKGNILRNLSVLAQRNDLQNWKEDSIVRYGQRWVIETVFSSIKRMFDGEYVYSAILKNMIQEMMLKAICITR